MKLLKFINRYWFVSLFLLFLIGGKIAYIAFYSNTKDIKVSDDYSKLYCAPDIPIYPASSIQIYLLEKPDVKAHPGREIGIAIQICSMDQSFDGSDQDRSLLFNINTGMLEFWTVQRHDIAQYFYRKIIEANPEDALSIYIKREKLKNES